jgi:formyltetrahydrofolate synthetase
MSANQILKFAQSIPAQLKAARIKKYQAAEALNMTRQNLFYKINNPSSFKVEELVKLDVFIKNSEKSRAMLGSNPGR